MFSDENAFTVNETRKILKSGLKQVLRIRLHADHLNIWYIAIYHMNFKLIQ